MAKVKTDKLSILKPASVLNWALQNSLRLDETRKKILRLARNPPQRSLATVNRLCRELAYKRLSFEDVLTKCDAYSGYVKMAASEVIPPFYNYLLENQIETTDEFDGERFPLAIGKLPNGETNFIKVDPTYFSLEGDRVTPVFVLGWTKIPFSPYQKQLISSIIYRAILTRQDFIGSDAIILTFPRDTWARKSRRRGGWRASQYAHLSDDALQAQFDRYGQALQDVLEFLEAEDEP